MAKLKYFEMGCKRLHFEKNDFKIYEPDFWEFWRKINTLRTELFLKGVF